MSRTPLLDKLRAQPPRAPQWIDPDRIADWRLHRDQMLLMLSEPALPAFNIDDVAQYYYVASAQEVWRVKDLTGLKPPYGRCWMEHKLPDRIHSEIGDQDITDLGGGDCGWLLLQIQKGGWKGEGIPEGTDTILCLEPFRSFHALGDSEGPDGAWLYPLDARGAPLGNPCLQTWVRQADAPLVRLTESAQYVPLLAISDAAVAGLRQPAFL